MKKSLLVFFILAFSINIFAQNITISGVVKDAETGETLIGANVLVKKGVGTVTDYNGKFSIEVEKGKYNIQVSYVGYKNQTKTINATKNIELTFRLFTEIIDEIQIVADVARERETPVAFTNVLPAQIEEELASQDIPMILNSTPGVYATQQGGGDGDARITIRGFNQRNVAVMLDGIPVNDMENGWVYWSNWFGLDAVTRSIQVQRGLGASKLAIPSVGGTMNILSKGIEARRGGNIKQEIGSNNFTRTSLGYTSGRLTKGWSYTFAGSFKQGDGWVEQTYTKGWFYFFRIDKQFKNHLLSVTGMGAPQSHGQRSYKNPIATYDKAYADKLIGNDTSYTEPPAVNLGLKYNEHWGYLERWTLDENGDTIHADVKKINTKKNYYHKPQFSLKDFWTISDKFTVSNILYASIGSGGGTGLKGGVSPVNNQVDLQTLYNNQATPNVFTGQQETTGYIYSSINNHYWYGMLSTMNYNYNDKLNFSGGIDLRSYRGEHYREMYDMLGGKIYYDENKSQINNNNMASTERHLGDKIYYHNDGLVRWAGVFGQAEYSNQVISGFLNLSVSNSGYKRIDYFRRKDLVLADTIISQAVGFSKTGTHQFAADTLVYNGNSYTVDSPEARDAQTDWKWIPGYTIKSGINYNLSEFSNVFMNAGILSKATRFNNVIAQNNTFLKDIKNELVKSVELGYSYHKSKFAINVNTYYTIWDNKPVQPVRERDADENVFTGYINGIDALHKGIELDFVYKINSKLEFQGLSSIGDWRWDSKATVNYYDEVGNYAYSRSFDAGGVHVGDAAQTQFAGSIRYEPFKGFYMKGKFTYFDNYYADFNPASLQKEAIDSWKLPSYNMVDLHIGYSFYYQDYRIKWSFNLLNALNEEYISDAMNNDPYNDIVTNDFDAKSATVFFGMGRRFTTSIKLSF